MSRRAVLAVLACAALTGSGLTAVVLTSNGSSSDATAGSTQSPDQRFLSLTGDRPMTTDGDDATQAAPTAAGQPDEDCTKSPETVGTLPNGWCLRPAGKSVDVLRFPLGITPTSNGNVVVTSDSGGVQGLTAVNQDTLATTQTTAGNLFEGVTETKDGRIFAAGGNANRVFRYKWVGPKLQSQDVTQEATFPIHGAEDGVLGRSPAGNQVIPAVDGIRVTSYPGQLVTYGDYVLAAGTLSEPSDGACPGKRNACGRLSVIDTKTDTVVGRAALGLDAYAIALDPVRKLAYVTNWADEAGRGNGSGTVSVVDLSKPTLVQLISLGAVGLLRSSS